jgi:hypothetical protein
LDAPDAPFKYLKLFNGTQAKEVGSPTKSVLKTVKGPKNQVLGHEI